MTWLFFQYGAQVPTAVIDILGSIFVCVSLLEVALRMWAYNIHKFWFAPNVFDQVANR